MSCLTEDVVFRFVQGELLGTEADEVDEHIASCAECRGLVADLARSSESEDIGGDTRPEPHLPPTSSSFRARHPGDVVGRYVLSRTIGAGGMGVVFLAQDPTLNRKVTLKLLHAERRHQRGAQQDLLREAQSMARLSHPNVVSVYDAGTFDEQVFMAMEFVEGLTLHDWLAEAHHPWTRILDVFLEAGRGLAAAHAVDMVHRDFKPRNVLVGNDGRTRVTDFGLALAGVTTNDRGSPLDDWIEGIADTGLTSALTESGALKGTPAYMAPEQFRGERADARSDQFSFCVALYEGFYGQRPFASHDVRELIVQILKEEVPPAPAEHPVPSALRAVVLRGLTKDPAKRWTSMIELLDALEAARTNGQPQAVALTPPPVVRPRRHVGRFVLGGASVAVAASLAVILPRRAPATASEITSAPTTSSEAAPLATSAQPIDPAPALAPPPASSPTARGSVAAAPPRHPAGRSKPTASSSPRPPQYDDHLMEPSFARKK
jgi:serine/threonine protein kinase